MKTPTEPWTKTPPTVQGWYWHWNGSEDCAPLPYSVLWGGTSKKCFIAIDQFGIDQAIDCDTYGGWWLELKQPPPPNYLTTHFDSPLSPSEKYVPIVLYFGSDAEADEFIKLCREACPNLTSSKF